MFARMRVRGRVAVRRVIATARRAAFLAYAQMNPTSAHFHALIALTALCVFDGRNSAICAQAPSAIVHRLLFGQHLMDEGNRDRTLADGRRNTFDIAAPDVADCEHSGQTRFEEMGSPGERPMRGGQIFLRQIRPRLDESFRVERDTATEPVGARNRAGHDENVADVVGLDARRSDRSASARVRDDYSLRGRRFRC